ncbi:MerR family DNA-binding protein [Streptomyces galilaeus]|uniref:MerR family DNA-binding protein n=1 Tax=Streptomyces galilaeus TaxID=33899 RepID=UPI001674F695|nr:MerR family DNA-binding protein [Streptomyces galilaeus]GGW80873.1 hypothetical protein GCM10010350_77130 [Streptomyces galilaeus]
MRIGEQAGLLPAPPRTSGGYCDYPRHALARLGFIRDAQAAGLTLAEIRSVLTLRDSGQAPCARVGALIDQHLAEIDRRMAELREARTELQELARRAAVTDPDSCSEGEICTILSRPGPASRPGPGRDAERGVRRRPCR